MNKSPSLRSPTAPTQPGDRCRWSGLQGSSPALALAELALKTPHPVIVITPSVLRLQTLKREVLAFLAERPLEIYQFPDWETLPYDHFSPHQDIISERILTLSRLPFLGQGLVFIPINTLLQWVLPKPYIQAHVFEFHLHQKIHLEQLRLALSDNGYLQVSHVMEPGEYAFRGSLCDLYPMGAPHPLRIDLFDDTIESLKSFDPTTQRSGALLEHFQLLPAREYPLKPEAITRFRNAWRSTFEGDPSLCPLYQDVSEGTPSAGIEYYLPLFFEEMAPLTAYFPPQSIIVQEGPLEAAAQQFWQEIRTRYEQRAHDRQHPILPPQQLFLSVDHLFNLLKAFPQIQRLMEPQAKTALRYATQSLPSVTIHPQAPQPCQSLENVLNTQEARLLFCVESKGREESLVNLLKPLGLQPKSYAHWLDFADDPQQTRFGVVVAALDQGFILEDPPCPFIFITETDLYGEQVMLSRARQKRRVDPFEAVHHLAELELGAPIVHILHGVGRYQGLITLTLGGLPSEYLCLEYQGHDKLYIPVSSLHLISRFSSTDAAGAPLHKLGTDTWEKLTKKAQEKMRDVAAELLDLYARRKAQTGFAFPIPREEYQRFSYSFGFEETPDQKTAIEQVLSDLASNTPMDRLICGDVGFGKTEVAMRATFIVAYAGKQVAILVPTTLLAQQHLESFQNRFAGWPFQIGILSRFQTKAEQAIVLEKLKGGQLDIVIGTHKLLQEEILFKDLGLLIVDEEHRFGVKQKERLKKLRAQVDLLTMTATPIPRTLNMALSAIRDFSVIATPPARRLPIKTFVHVYEEVLIREAILREIMRGGQVYYLHNDVASIEKTAEILTALVPEARFGTAHGQMNERFLEKVMNDFYHQRFHVLICSTIIETGIDIPTANTIIIERADKLGLGQLHQLRGRVGRSHHQAYAYCLTPPEKQMTSDAHKRLEALSEHEELGAGFHIASHDLEIRGAGELLGEEQSGHAESIGYTLYMELLERTVNALKSGKTTQFMTPLDEGMELDLHMPAFIPELYLPDVSTRLVLYKRIAHCKTQNALDEIQVEMIDRFGLLPPTAQRLFSLSQLKLLAQPLGIRKIDYGASGGFIEFLEHTPIDPKRLIQLIQQAPKYHQLQGNRLRLKQEIADFDQRVDGLKTLFNVLSGHVL